ncbi:hypothetical protein Vafri_7322 [Volvox africanus]|uniref:Uncharacterized protein n=1 Tax=Volvox africanus TaxID=51714 RepID=A0A8J4EXX6_9CHLO|nr:hypothetical protein Vafri_7322 [Volvox africanus]
MACNNSCARLLSELADEYDRSSTILVQLELALELRTPASNCTSEATSDASVVKEGMSVARVDPKIQNMKMISQLNGSNQSPPRRPSSSSDGESDVDFDVADMVALRCHSMTSLQRDHAEECPVLVTRALSFQPQRHVQRPMTMTRPERPVPVRMQGQPQSQPQYQHQKPEMEISNPAFISCSNVAGRPSTCAQRALSDPSVVLVDSTRRPTTTATNKSLALTGVSFLASITPRCRPPLSPRPPLLQRSTSRRPLLSWTSTGASTSSGATLSIRPPSRPVSGLSNEVVTPAMPQRRGSGNVVANPYLLGSTQRSCDTALNDTPSPAIRQPLRPSTCLQAQPGMVPGPVVMAPLLPSLGHLRRKRGFTEHGGFRMPVQQASEETEEDYVPA